MSFVIQRVSGSALVMSQVAADVLLIGRGTNCDLRSENPSVALVHAEITPSGAGYTIVDKGSVTGTYVNAKAVDSALLSKGDVIEIGDLRIQVQLADPAKPLFLQVSPVVVAEISTKRPEVAAPLPAKMPAGGALRAQKLDYAAAYRLSRPYLTRLAVAALVLIATLMLISEVLRPERRSLLMPGAVSSAHTHARDASGNPIATNCGACHHAWRSVSDTKCMACHGRAPHAERQAESPSCMSCHFEHRGQPKLAMIPAVRCVVCHGDLPRHIVGQAPPPVAPHITAFGIDHPPFEPVSDRDTLRFNHKRHLRPSGVKDDTGKREVLTCTSCHRLVESRGKFDPVPLQFEAHCQRCHKLAVDDEIFPGVEFPHGGDSTQVYGFILATDTRGSAPDVIKTATTTADVMNTSCGLCHGIEKAGQRLVATPPVLQAIWMHQAKFTHTTHRNIDCEACHKKVRASSATADVLVPQQDACVSCHGPKGNEPPSSCATCHVYHERSKLLTAGIVMPSGRRRAMAVPQTDETDMLQMVLLYAIVILLLVVMVPVALAFFRRLTASADRAAAPERAAPPPPVQPKPAAAPAAVEEKVASPAVPPRANATHIMTRTPPSAGATEMVEWYGTLVCTSGALQGQTFMIEEGGVWIGRDRDLAQIVIDDTRISKRHVRIVVRNGRVHAIDTDSTNGTFLDKVGDRITDVELKRNNTLILGDNVASFVYKV